MDKIIIGVFYSLLAGMIIATQNVFSTRISEKIGMWETTAVVHLVGLVFALIMAYIFGKGSYGEIPQVDKVYFLAGILGVMIIFSVTMGVSSLGASFSISLIIIGQLLFSTVIDSLGLFGSDRMNLDYTKILGIIIMIMGLVVFKSRG